MSWPPRFAPPADQAPGVLTGSDDHWRDWRRRLRHAAKPWDFEAEWIHGFALDPVPRPLPVARFLRELGAGMVQGFMPAPLPPPAVVVRLDLPGHFHRLPEPGDAILAAELTPGAADDQLFIDLRTGEWSVPGWQRCGDDLVSLAHWRLGTDHPFRAARMIATLFRCGVSQADFEAGIRTYA